VVRGEVAKRDAQEAADLATQLFEEQQEAAAADQAAAAQRAMEEINRAFEQVAENASGGR
jgi:hypothetical protein